MFGLKSFQHEDILAAFLAFRDEAGSLARHSATIVTRNFLVAAFDPSSIPTNPPLHQVQPGANQKTALSKHIGK